MVSIRLQVSHLAIFQAILHGYNTIYGYMPLLYIPHFTELRYIAVQWTFLCKQKVSTLLNFANTTKFIIMLSLVASFARLIPYSAKL